MPSRPVTNLLRPLSHTRPASTSVRTVRHASRSSLRPLPEGYPQVDMSGSAMYVFRSIGRSLKWVIYIGGGSATLAFLAFEGVHTYIEYGPLAIRGSADEYGWAEEAEGWSGGRAGGTDPRLGWKGRIAVRAAWMAQNWGVGASTTSGQGLFEPDHVAVRGMIGVDPTAIGGDRGYNTADEYLNVALATARQRGLVFPPTLSASRPVGPPVKTTPAELQGDLAVLELLERKAGVLERIATRDSLAHAKEIYEHILCAIHGSASPAKELRLTTKIGDLCIKAGDDREALAWWGWGLQRVGLTVPSGLKEIKESAKARLGAKPTPEIPSVNLSDASPSVLRATISLLVSSAAYLATHSHLAAASTLQSTALTLLPPPTQIPPPTTATAGLTLHATWLQQRSALLTLHLAGVNHALRKSALNLATTASARADNVVSALTPLSPAYSGVLAIPAKVLQRDALLTAAEAAYTQGILLERNSPSDLVIATECFEKALALYVREYGAPVQDIEDAGPEYQKYQRSLERVREKISSTGNR